MTAVTNFWAYLNLLAVDDNGNGIIDPTEDQDFYNFAEVSCNEELQRDMQHEGRMAAMNAEQEEIYARMQARMETIIEGARREVGL